MDLTIFILLGSGLFLGWSLGANDAANVFGTAVGTRMVRFATAATVCSIFVILGAIVSGQGAAETLGKLGAVNAIAGSFMAALAAAVTVYGMTRAGLPVSTSQAVVGAIVGWNLFSDSVTDFDALMKILLTWVACPLLAGMIAVPVFKLVEVVLAKAHLHLLRLDAYTRVALVVAGAFGAYSLGANNIANVMGVFVNVSPFTDFTFESGYTMTSVQQLFLLGGLAIAVGVFTYSKRVMLTVGNDLMPMSPVEAWVVVVAHSIVLFLFASVGLENFLASAGLPTLPLVPVSSSQAVIGAVIGLGLMRGGRNIRWSILGQITVGWLTTPFLAAIVCFVGLFFLQNVFDQRVYEPVTYRFSPPVVAKLEAESFPKSLYEPLQGQAYPSSREIVRAVTDQGTLSTAQQRRLLHLSRDRHLLISDTHLSELNLRRLSDAQLDALRQLEGERFQYGWQLDDALASLSPAWRPLPKETANRLHNKQLRSDLDYLYRVFRN